MNKLLGAVAATLGFSATFLVASPASATPSACDAVVGNLIANCGFETGDSSNWVLLNSPSGSNQGISTDAHTGNYAWTFSGTNPTAPNWDIIYQVFGTSSGDTYNVTFWEESDGHIPNLFFAGDEISPFTTGNSQIVLSNQPAHGYKQYQFTFAANSAFSLVYFGGWDPETQSGGGVQTFDDVVVTDITHVPEPLTLSLFGAGLVGAAALRRRKRKVALDRYFDRRMR
jgi:hypothetical protein